MIRKKPSFNSLYIKRVSAVDNNVKGRLTLTDKGLAYVKENVVDGHTIKDMCHVFRINVNTFHNIVNRDERASEVYGEARKLFFKPELTWFKSLFENGKIDKIDPAILLRAFEIKMKARANWGTQDIDGLNIEHPNEDEDEDEVDEEFKILAKARARLLDIHKIELEELVSKLKASAKKTASKAKINTDEGRS